MSRSSPTVCPARSSSEASTLCCIAPPRGSLRPLASSTSSGPRRRYSIAIPPLTVPLQTGCNNTASRLQQAPRLLGSDVSKREEGRNHVQARHDPSPDRSRGRRRTRHRSVRPSCRSEAVRSRLRRRPEAAEVAHHQEAAARDVGGEFLGSRRGAVHPDPGDQQVPGQKPPWRTRRLGRTCQQEAAPGGLLPPIWPSGRRSCCGGKSRTDRNSGQTGTAAVAACTTEVIVEEKP